MADARAVAFLRELERTDDDVAATLAELDELARQVEGVRLRALELEAFLTRAPAERKALEAARADAERGTVDAGTALQRAEREAEEAEARRDERRLAEARNGLVRARDAASMAERRLSEAGAELAVHDERVTASGREAVGLDEGAHRLAAALRERPRLAEQAGAVSGEGLEGIAEWASGARAALFVARGSLANERDGLLRQANELGSAVLGEPLASARPGVIAERLERNG